MKISGWQIDGFGVLHDTAVDGLEGGVTVLLGANEAGKSTLLAFLRAMLFGFPDRRGNENPYEPVNGGRHGGRLQVTDDEGLVWTIERHADKKKTLGVTRPGGHAGDEADLRRLLGGADGPLFKSVFAFSLSELQVFATLDNDSIRDRIFTAGVTGAGKSARDVMGRLDQQTEALLKTRGAARINGLLEQLDDLGARLNQAETAAEGYAQLVAAEGAADADAAAALERARDTRAREQLLRDLIELSADQARLNELGFEAAALPVVHDTTLPERVEALAAQLTAQTTREENLEQTRRDESAAAAQLTAALRVLGDDWTIERVHAVDDSLPARVAVREQETELAEARQRLASAERGVSDSAARVAELERDHADLVAALAAEEPPSALEIERRGGTLSGLATDLDQLRLMAVQGESLRPPRGLAIATVALTAALLVAALIATVGGSRQLALGLAAGAVVAAVLAIAFRLAGQAPAGSESSQPASLRSRISETATSLGLPSSPSSADIASAQATLQTQRAARVAFDSRSEQAAKTLRRLDEAQRLALAANDEHAAAADRLAEAERNWAEFASTRGLPPLDPLSVQTVFDTTSAARAADEALQRARDTIEGIERAAGAWTDEAREVLVEAGRPAAGLDHASVRAAFAALAAAVARRVEIDGTVAELERHISATLGDDAARAELDRGDLAGWRLEADELAAAALVAERERETAIEARRDAQRAREALERSADIPRLEEERQSLLAELDEAARSYRVTALARQLIAGTLRTFVRERQPDVLARASQTFSLVTGGRYITVRQDESGGESIVVVTPSDVALTPDQLSRGTAEQLYLTLRLALVHEFARHGTPLPMIMDDCLVNFDPQRAGEMATAILAAADDGQCLLLTCHPSTAELVRERAGGSARIVELSRL